ncbi:MAG: peptide chain release factor N(5)-glutamine methyltransferase [Flavobacteriales bacterium]|nr:peptide chain release factor N(5)-glutamine methyltransferase [Flavobacteriales bacterium]
MGSVLKTYRSILSERYDQGEVRAITRSVFRDVLRWDAAQVETRKEEALSNIDSERLTVVLKRLGEGEPLQYVLGHTTFMGLDIAVSSGVLIPRPETEEMVDMIGKQGVAFQRIVDIGTGSGCIAIALRSLFPSAEVIGMDVSLEALAVARANGRSTGMEVEWLAASILEPNVGLPGRCDLVVSNPPYVPLTETTELEEHVRAYEPHLALFVNDEDPLLFYRAIAEKAMIVLVKSGQLWFEGHYRYASSIGDLLVRMGYKNVRVIKDLGGHQRFINATR